MEENIKLYMNQLVKEDVFPGVCYAFFYKDYFFVGCVGNRSLVPKKEKNTVNTIYDIASLTKLTVVNPLISLAIQNKEIDVNDSLQKYFPEFPFPNVTIFHLITHSSGLYARYDKNHVKGKEEILTNLDLPIEPGTNIEYRDVNFLLLGFLIEKIYASTLDVLAQKYVFEPLNMNETGYLPVHKNRCAPTEVTAKRGIVRGIVHDEKAAALGGVAGNAGVFSTIEDIAKFVKMIINRGKVANKQVLSADIIDGWFKPLITDPKGIARGMGWVIGSTIPDTKNFASSNSVFHTGFVGNEILIDRDHEYAMILLSNRVHPTRENNKLIDRRGEINEECYRIITMEGD